MNATASGVLASCPMDDDVGHLSVLIARVGRAGNFIDLCRVDRHDIALAFARSDQPSLVAE